MAVGVLFLLDTTRGAVVGDFASPRCWHGVKKHAQRLVCAPLSFIVFADTPRSPSRRMVSTGVSGAGVWGGCPRALDPRFSLWGVRGAFQLPFTFCLKSLWFRVLSLPPEPGTVL